MRLCKDCIHFEVCAYSLSSLPVCADYHKKVVHCMACQYYDEATVNVKGFLICPASGMEITDMDYCSYGEWRENND
jgi:hypothetical protein